MLQKQVKRRVLVLKFTCCPIGVNEDVRAGRQRGMAVSKLMIWVRLFPGILAGYSGVRRSILLFPEKDDIYDRLQNNCF